MQLLVQMLVLYGNVTLRFRIISKTSKIQNSSQSSGDRNGDIVICKMYCIECSSIRVTEITIYKPLIRLTVELTMELRNRNC